MEIKSNVSSIKSAQVWVYLHANRRPEDFQVVEPPVPTVRGLGKGRGRGWRRGLSGRWPLSRPDHLKDVKPAGSETTPRMGPAGPESSASGLYALDPAAGRLDGGDAGESGTAAWEGPSLASSGGDRFGSGGHHGAPPGGKPVHWAGGGGRGDAEPRSSGSHRDHAAGGTPGLPARTVPLKRSAPADGDYARDPHSRTVGVQPGGPQQGNERYPGGQATPGTMHRPQGSGNAAWMGVPVERHGDENEEELSESTATETESDSPGRRAQALQGPWGSQASLVSMGSAGPTPSGETGGRYSRDMTDVQQRPLGALYGRGSMS